MLLLRLSKETFDLAGATSLVTQFTLPNGKRISQINPAESALQFRNIFVDNCYLQGGVTVRRGDVVVDVGANVGLASLFAHWFAPDVTVYAFEPASLMFAALESNLRDHGVRGRAMQCALGRTSGARNLMIYPDKTAMSGFYVDPDRDLRITRRFLENSGFAAADIDDLVLDRPATLHESVPVTTLSEWWESAGIERIDLLKINVERGEQDVLAGIRTRHWPKIHQVAMQVHDDVRDLADLRQEFETNGFCATISQDPLLAGTGIFDLHAWRGEKA